MKKKLLATLLLSTVVLGSVTTTFVVTADETDDKIASQDAKIASTKSAEAKAQAEVATIQAQVDELKSKQDKLQKEIDDLHTQSEKLQVKILDLTKEIGERDEALKAQARSAQTEGSATSYVDAILNAKSLSDAVTRISAMRTVVKANNDMLEQQEKAKTALDKAVKSNQAKANEGYKLLNQIDEQAKTLETQQATLKVAQLNLAAERATAEDEKAILLDEKAAAQALAAEAAAKEQAYKAQVVASLEKAKTEVVKPVVPDSVFVQPKEDDVAIPDYTTTGNTYPVGQCTWGVKELARWAGNYWGNGGQWASSAVAAGFRTGATPQVGAIMVTPGPTVYGHVAYVDEVSGNQIQVRESNYNGDMSIKNYRGWFTPSGATFIYPPY